MTDAAGDIVWEATYEAFGKAAVDPDSTIINNLRFPGQYLDEETGLHWNWHRYYDPGTGRYVSEDPIGLSGGDENTYRYSFNNPQYFSDPDGLSSINRIIVCEYNGNLQYGAEAFVFHGDEVSRYTVNIRADNGTRIADGTYYYKAGTHKMSGGRKSGGFNNNGWSYKALNIFSDKKMRNRNIPAALNSLAKKFFSGINVHVGNSMQFGKERCKTAKTGSQGCTTVPAVTNRKDRSKLKMNDMSTWSYYDDFVSKFGVGETGEYIVTSDETLVVKELIERAGAK